MGLKMLMEVESGAGVDEEVERTEGVRVGDGLDGVDVAVTS